MGLPVRQRRVLERIESTLRGSDPKLAALYAIFARLTRDEEMPRVEQLRHRANYALLRLRLRLASAGSRLFARLIPRQRSVLLFPLAVGLAVVSIVFAAQSNSRPGCVQITRIGALAEHAHPSKACRMEPEPLGFAH